MSLYDCGHPECEECRQAFGPDRSKAIAAYEARERFYASGPGPMTRKIIQLTVTPMMFFGIVVGYVQHALCDDGTIWYRDATSKKDSSWKPSDDKIPNT